MVILFSRNSTRQLQSITNNNNNSSDMMSTNNRTHIPVDSFVQLNLKPSVEISVQDYKVNTHLSTRVQRIRKEKN